MNLRYLKMNNNEIPALKPIGITGITVLYIVSSGVLYLDLGLVSGNVV